MWRLLRVNALLTLALGPLSYGYEGYSSLKVGVGARELAMGSAGVASALGAGASYFNPALIGSYKGFTCELDYNRWFLGSQRASVFLVRPFKRFNFGLGVLGFDAGRLEYYSEDRPRDEGPQGYFGAQDLTLFSSLAAQFDPNTTGGVSLKFYYEKIYLNGATGLGLDFGLGYQLSSRFKWGFSVNNFGSLMTFKSEPFSLPTNVKLGLSFALPVVLLAEDLSFYFYTKDIKSSTGLEVGIHKNLFLQVGYRLFFRYYEPPSQKGDWILDTTEGLSFGLSLKVDGLRLDYAYLPYGLDLGSTHHISLNIGD